MLRPVVILSECLEGIEATEVLQSLNTKTLVKIHSKPAVILDILEGRSVDFLAIKYLKHVSNQGKEGDDHIDLGIILI